MAQLLSSARAAGASDFHIIVGSPPVVRKFGTLQEFGPAPINAAEAETLLFNLLDPAQRELLLKNKYLDTSLVLEDERYRMCILKQKNGYDGSFRMIRKNIATPKSLGLSETVMTQLTNYHQGLVLVTGPSGCGKSTTVAAMLEMINQKRSCHIISLEDPIENVFVPNKAHFSQRQLIDHTASFSAALRAALREDPDVIMIGELRDYETASLAITASETGHLVISTLHTTSAVRTITRLLDMFPADQKQQIQMMISESLRGIIAQKLIPLENNAGQVLATEILINNSAIGSLIRKSQFIQIPSVVQTGAALGMHSMDSSISDHLKAGTISGLEAYFASENQAPHQRFAPKDE
ncbi:MAG: hypothetical protein A2070_08020 [Bdellovibrionales bacterium GWC1_52_8]|nr:MAG: hypothetical protein A2Z97_04980 [Bdellovibrionales bacterium GWB1_52_6]OFZ06447.1 MAG: hypothetical protein A2X97_02830 [Bdellovibrionales bacterium GWA1_52_35]OFZ39983.1 MAG: hypothetical protein A2070_08020 [Bdellovibrionales bacterium GWC1_52_8]